MSLPFHATTYQLSRIQVTGQQARRDRELSLRHLAAMGIPAAIESDGTVRGVITIDPRRFLALPGAPIAPRQAFEVTIPGTLRFADPSPLSQLGDLPFMETTSLAKMVDRLVRAWSQRVQLIEAALLTARNLTPNAQLFGDPWRIEGEVSFRHCTVRIMFSTRGDRACVCAVDGRPVDRAPQRRKILPVDSRLSDELWQTLLADAVAQAIPCLGQPVVSRAEMRLSIDLAARDLAVRPTVELPPEIPVPTVVSAPPRMPPRGAQAPLLVGASTSRRSVRSSEDQPTVVSRPPTLPRPHLASNPRSLVIDDDDVLSSVDLTTED